MATDISKLEMDKKCATVRSHIARYVDGFISKRGTPPPAITVSRAQHQMLSKKAADKGGDLTYNGIQLKV